MPSVEVPTLALYQNAALLSVANRTFNLHGLWHKNVKLVQSFKTRVWLNPRNRAGAVQFLHYCCTSEDPKTRLLSRAPFYLTQSRMLVQVSLRRVQVYELHPQKGGSTPRRHIVVGLERVAGVEDHGKRDGAGEVGWLWRYPGVGWTRPGSIWGAAGFLSETHAGHAGV